MLLAAFNLGEIALNPNRSITNIFWTRRSLILLVVVVTMIPQVGSAQAPSSKPVKLKCDALVNPLGIDSNEPMLSWQLRDARFGARQTAYEIQVASHAELLSLGKPDVWDSGRVESDRSAGVKYAGPALIAEKRYFWRVKVWDKDGTPYPASDASWWGTGLLEAKEWRAKWIGLE